VDFELFEGVQTPATASMWNSVVLNSIQTELCEDTRTKLLLKYKLKENLQAPSKLKEQEAALTPSVKR